MGYPQLLHLLPAEEILVGQGLRRRRWRRFCGGVRPGTERAERRAQALSCSIFWHERETRPSE